MYLSLISEGNLLCRQQFPDVRDFLVPLRNRTAAPSLPSVVVTISGLFGDSDSVGQPIALWVAPFYPALQTSAYSYA